MILASYFDNLIRNIGGAPTAWTIFGFAANACFVSRFLVQWYASERRKESVVPVAFWYLSMVGGVMMLVYTIHIGKLPLILGAVFTPIVAWRNLRLITRNRKPPTAAARPTGSPIEPANVNV